MADADVFVKAQAKERIVLIFDLDFGESGAFVVVEDAQHRVRRLPFGRAKTLR